MRRCYELRNQFAVRRIVRVSRRLNDGFKQSFRRVGPRGNKLLGSGVGAAWVPVPNFLGKQMDEANAIVDGALVHRIGRQEAVELAGFHFGDHLRRRNRGNLQILVRVDPVLRQIIAKQIIG